MRFGDSSTGLWTRFGAPEAGLWAYFVSMGYPDPQNPGQHPGGQNYPAQPPGYRPTRPFERDDTVYPGGYQLDYGQGAAYPGQQPPPGPPLGPGGPGGPGGGEPDGGGNNKKVLWLAAVAVVLVLVLAGIAVAYALSGSTKTTASPTTVPTTTTTVPTTTGGFQLPSSITVPPIFGGGSTTGANARQWKVDVTGTGTAQLVTIGIPDVSLFGDQNLPWSKTFTRDSMIVSVTVIGYTGDVGCTISRNGTVVSQATGNSETDGGAPLICSSSR